MINLINKDSQFNTSLKTFPSGKATVAIFGTQSSGKSTLLNHAFGTNFPTLNLSLGVHRCTVGVWYQNNGTYNLIDTEGFDSRERVEEGSMFEKQIALYSLIIADTIIINMWTDQISRETGSHNQIIKSIIKVCDRMTNKETKRIIFTIQKYSPQDQDKQLMIQFITNNFNRILENQKKNQQNSTILIKFQLKFLFLSDFNINYQDYKTQALELKNLIKQKQSQLSSYNEKDRVVFLNNIWNKILSPEMRIDLQSQDDAMKLYICKKIKDQILDNFSIKIKPVTNIFPYKSYQKMLEYYIKTVRGQFNRARPIHVNQGILSQKSKQIFEEVSFIFCNHFTSVILPNEQDRIIDRIIKPITQQTNQFSLDKIIIEKKKQASQVYKNIVEGHREGELLAKKFDQKINYFCLPFQRESRNIFSKFQNQLQKQLNKQLDIQIDKLQFNRQKIIKTIVKVCKKFQYNDWQVNLDQAWDKVVHRALNTKIPQKIQIYSKLKNDNVAIWDGSLDQQIALHHKQLQKKIQQLVVGLLRFYNEDVEVVYQMDRVRQKIWSCNKKSIQKENKRFKFSMLTLVIFLFLLYGEFMLIINILPLSKKKIKKLGYLYLFSVITLLVIYIYRNYFLEKQSIKTEKQLSLKTQKSKKK